MLKCPLIYYYRERPPVFVNMFIILFGELRGPLNKCLNYSINSKVLVKVLLNNNIIRLVLLGKIYP